MTSNSYQEDIDRLREIGNIPRHVAIIMDGNGRWAKSQDRPRVFGHRNGVKTVRSTVEMAGRLGVEALTLYAFSEENWGRPKFEVNTIMGLFDRYLVNELASLKAHNVRFRAIGNLSALRPKTRELLAETEHKLAQNTGLKLNIAVSYGARSEIVAAVKAIGQKLLDGGCKIDDISPDLFASHLWTDGLPELDLMIRTSGELRISNFLLWQMAYAELFFTNVEWPSFTPPHFFAAIESFQNRKRRFGLVDVAAEAKDENRERAHAKR